MPNKLEGLVLKVSGENRASFIIALVLIAAFAIGIAVLAALYVLNRRKLVEANSRIRQLDEQAKQVAEKAKLEQEEKKRRALELQAVALRNRIEQQKKAMAAVEKDRKEFDSMLDRIKSWQDLKVVGP